MAKTRYRNQNHVYHERDMFSSPAYLSLSGKSIQVLMLFHCKKQVESPPKGTKPVDWHWPIINNGKITFTYAEADQLGISNRQFAHAINQLHDRGFINVKQPGGGVNKSASLYEITFRWKRWGKEDFKMKLRPKPRFRIPGMGFKPGHSPYKRTSANFPKHT